MHTIKAANLAKVERLLTNSSTAGPMTLMMNKTAIREKNPRVKSFKSFLGKPNIEKTVRTTPVAITPQAMAAEK